MSGIKFSALSSIGKPDVGRFGTPAQAVGLYAGANVLLGLPDYDSPGSVQIVTQAGHTFIIGDTVYKLNSGGSYALASTVTEAMAIVAGVVIDVGSGGSADKFALQSYGVATVGSVSGGRYTGALTEGSVYYLSSTGGLASATVPASGAINRPVFQAISTTNVLIFGGAPSISAPAQYIDFTQSSPSFVVGQAVYATNTGYAAADKTVLATATVVGVITQKSSNTYRLVFSGIAKIGNASGGTYTGDLTEGGTYYLTTSGVSTNAAPTSGISKLVFVALDVNNALIIPGQPVKISGAVTVASAATPIPALSYTPTPTDVPHGLSGVPTFVRPVWVCTTAEFGFTLGQEVDYGTLALQDHPGGTDRITNFAVASYTLGASNITVNWSCQGGATSLIGTNSSGYNYLTIAHWSLKFYSTLLA